MEITFKNNPIEETDRNFLLFILANQVAAAQELHNAGLPTERQISQNDMYLKLKSKAEAIINGY